MSEPRKSPASSEHPVGEGASGEDSRAVVRNSCGQQTTPMEEADKTNTNSSGYPQRVDVTGITDGNVNTVNAIGYLQGNFIVNVENKITGTQLAPVGQPDSAQQPQAPAQQAQPPTQQPQPPAQEPARPPSDDFLKDWLADKAEKEWARFKKRGFKFHSQ